MTRSTTQGLTALLLLGVAAVASGCGQDDSDRPDAETTNETPSRETVDVSGVLIPPKGLPTPVWTRCGIDAEPLSQGAYVPELGAYADEEGTWRRSELRPGTYRVFARCPDGVEGDVEVELRPDEPLDDVTIEMESPAG